MRKPTPAEQKEWSEKLKASGFKDIEDSNGNLFPETFTSNWQTKAEYYRYASHHYWQLDGWRNEGDRRIWGLHSEGLEVREIAARVGRSKSAVDRVIQRERQRMLRTLGLL